MTQAHIVIIEDEADLLELEEYHLQKAGYFVTGFSSVVRVEDLLEEEKVDLMIVDRNLPGTEGSEFVAHLRRVGYNVPVIFVSAKDQEQEVEEGFDRGGDDYLTKPFNMNELLLRIRAILRRTRGEETGKLRHRMVTLDLDRRIAVVEGNTVPLSRLEFELLHFFLRHPETTLSRDQLLEGVWGDMASAQHKTVTVTINRLLAKLDPKRLHTIIEPIRGIGYRLC